MENNIKHGMVVTDTFNNNNDGIILSVTCKTEQFSKSSIFIDLVDTILLNCMHQLPTSTTEILNMDIEDNKYLYPKLDLIEDAINEVSKNNNQEIVLDYYNLERITVGRDHLCLFAKNSPDNKAGTILMVGGQVITKDSIYKNVITEKLMPVLDQILITDPLALRLWHMPEYLINYLKDFYRSKFEKQGYATYFDVITNTNKKCSLLEERKVEIAVEQKIIEFRKNYILEDQPFPMINNPSNKQNVIQYLANLGVYIFKDFVRYSIK